MDQAPQVSPEIPSIIPRKSKWGAVVGMVIIGLLVLGGAGYAMFGKTPELDFEKIAVSNQSAKTNKADFSMVFDFVMSGQKIYIDFSMTSVNDSNDENNPIGEVSITARGEAMGQTFAFVADMKIVNSTIYARLREMNPQEALQSFDFEQYKNKWIRTTLDDIAKLQSQNTASPVINEQYFRSLITQSAEKQRQFFKLVESTKPLNFGKAVKGGTIEGEGTYMYDFSLNREGAKKFITGAIAIIYPPEILDLMKQNLVQLDAGIDMALKNITLSGTITAGAKTSRLYDIHSVMKADGSDIPSGTKGELTFDQKNYDYGIPVQVETPLEFIELQQILDELEKANVELGSSVILGPETIGPTREFGLARNAQRRSEIMTILNAVNQYRVDNGGTLPAVVLRTPTEICATGSPNCSSLVDLSMLTRNDVYLKTIPIDPLCPEACSVFGTGYLISKSASERVTVSAMNAELGEKMSVTR